MYTVDTDVEDVAVAAELGVAVAEGLYANANTLYIFANYNAKGELLKTVNTVVGVANVVNKYESATAYAVLPATGVITGVVFVAAPVEA